MLDESGDSYRIKSIAQPCDCTNTSTEMGVVLVTTANEFRDDLAVSENVLPGTPEETNTQFELPDDHQKTDLAD